MARWIKLYLEFIKWEWFAKPEMVQLFVWLLLRANPVDKQWRGIRLLRGQVLTTYKEMREETKLTEQKLRTCIGRLKSTNEITCKSTNKYTLITICNYENYQDKKAEINEQITNKSTNKITNNQRTNNERCTANCTVTLEDKDIYITTSSARAREDEYIATMKTQQIWLEAMAKNFGKDVPAIIALLDEFAVSNECRDITHKDIKDARRHFNDWLYKYNEARKTNGNSNSNPKNINVLWQ